jgi:DNA-directed RNA polymerase-3 subunit RPC5
MELDLAIKTNNNFDKIKGVTWGEALRTAKESGTNAFGLASGFGKGIRTNEMVAQDRVQIVARTGDDRIEKLVSKFDESNAQGHVMNKQTLGGQIIPPEEGRPMYMLGAFRGGTIALHRPRKYSSNQDFRGASSFKRDWYSSNASTIPPH